MKLSTVGNGISRLLAAGSIVAANYFCLAWAAMPAGHDNKCTSTNREILASEHGASKEDVQLAKKQKQDAHPPPSKHSFKAIANLVLAMKRFQGTRLMAE